MNLLNVSDQADVNALVVHWSTPWSIADAFEFEEANVDRRKKRKAQRRLNMLCGRAGSEGEPRDSHNIYVMAKIRGLEGVLAGAKLRRTISRSSKHDALTPRSRERMEEPHWQPDSSRNRGAYVSMTKRPCGLSDKGCTNIPPHYNSGLRMTASAATRRYKHESSLHTGVSGPRFSLHPLLRPPWARGIVPVGR